MHIVSPCSTLLQPLTFLSNCTWQNEEIFFRDYAAAHKKLSELGFVPPTLASRVITAVKNSSTMAKTAAGVVALAATAAAITYFYRQRNQKLE